MKRNSLVAAIALVAILFAMFVPALPAQKKGDTDTRNVNGQVVDKGSNPLPKAVVYLKNTKTLQMRTYIADESGAFHFQGLTGNVDYELHAEHEGASSPVKTISSFDSRKDIQVSLKISK